MIDKKAKKELNRLYKRKLEWEQYMSENPKECFCYRDEHGRLDVELYRKCTDKEPYRVENIKIPKSRVCPNWNDVYIKKVDVWLCDSCKKDIIEDDLETIIYA